MGREGRSFVFRERRWERMAALTMDAYAQFAGWPAARPSAAVNPGAAPERLGQARTGGAP